MSATLTLPAKAVGRKSRIRTFDDWVDLFHDWQKQIDLQVPGIRDFQFEAKYGELRTSEIEFGDFAGQAKWEKVTDIPLQPVRDALLNLIVYQGDTEFASVEQQRNLFRTAPSEYDLSCAVRIMAEEMRHGWQMCHILVSHFGETGRIEAQKLLQRRSWQHNRLLGSFNEDVLHWLDFYVYTDFIDRDGKFQLNMLQTSAFAPLARSMGPMLKEEAYHLGSGQTGLLRIVKAGVIPTPVIQKYLNKWIPTAYDLFGVDHSSSAEWFYVWGLKGRFDEHKCEGPADRRGLNELSRGLYQKEAIKLIEDLNKVAPAGQPRLTAPDLKFNRAIGDLKGLTYSVTGELLSPEAFARHREEVLPTAQDEALLAGLFENPGWIAPREGAGH